MYFFSGKSPCRGQSSLVEVNKVPPAVLELGEFSSQSVQLFFGGLSRGKGELPFLGDYHT